MFSLKSCENVRINDNAQIKAHVPQHVKNYNLFFFDHVGY